MVIFKVKAFREANPQDTRSLKLYAPDKNKAMDYLRDLGYHTPPLLIEEVGRF